MYKVSFDNIFFVIKISATVKCGKRLFLIGQRNCVISYVTPRSCRLC